MAKTLTNIETLTQFFGRNDLISLTDTDGLALSNYVYRGLISAFPWAEFTRRAVLTSPTVVSQENYQWTGEDFPVFMDILAVEIESDSYDSPTTSSDVFGTSTVTEATSRQTWKRLVVPPDEFEWDLAGRLADVDRPYYYRFFLSNRHIIVAADVGDGTNRWHSVNDGTTWVQTTTANIGDEVRYYAATAVDGTGASTATDTNRIAIRPRPSVAGYEIRATGIIEPTALTLGSSVTTFLQSSADDAMAHILAASFAFRDGFEELGASNIATATSMLQKLLGKEQITAETVQGLI